MSESSPTSPNSSPSTPRSIASYRIVEEIGAVPEGRAYRAVDTRSEDPVLLKILEPPTDPTDKSWQESLQRTRRLGRLSHRSLPILYQIGMSSEGPFVAFSPPPGVPLRHFVSEGGRVHRHRLVEWSSQLLGLLAEAHAEGLFHGHLGVDSIFVEDEDKLYLTGFGLTRLLPDTPEVQAPERRKGGLLLPSSDLYSLAALMQRLGAPVEMGGASTEPLASGDPLLQVFKKATAEDPRDRFGDAVEMSRALRAAAKATLVEPVMASSLRPPAEEQSVAPAADPALSTVAMDPETLRSLVSPEVELSADPELSTDPELSADPEVEAAFREAPAKDASAASAASVPPVVPVDPVAPADKAAAAAPPEEKPWTPPSKKGAGRWWWAALLLLLLLGVAYYLFTQREARPQAPAAEAPPPAEPIAAPEAVAAEPADGAAAAGEDPVLHLARLLAEQEGETLFGNVELDTEEQALMATLRQDIEELDFPAGDALGGQQADSLFAENPLLGTGNPLLSQKLRERWLTSAIANIGPQMALAHIQEETEKLRRGEIDRAEWYEHVAQCKDFCNHVVSGLLFEHVRQVQARPNHLVLFGTGSTEVGGEAGSSLRSFLAETPEDPGFLLIGRSSRSGNRDRNREISRRRVEGVRDFLAQQGIGADRLHTFWLGYEPPQLSAELARVYGLDDSLPAEALNQSVLIVAFDKAPDSTAGG